MRKAGPRLSQEPAFKAFTSDARTSAHRVPPTRAARRNAPGQARLFRLDELDGKTRGLHASVCLLVEEQLCANRMRKFEEQRRWINCHAAMRHILVKLTGRQTQDLLFMRGSKGKPFVPDGPHFNLSHSRSMALLAVSSAGPSGIDLEIEGHGLNFAAAAALTLSPAEQYCLEIGRWKNRPAFFAMPGFARRPS